MKPEDKTREELLKEMEELRGRIAELEMESGHKGWEERLTGNENLLQTIIETEPECIKLVARDGSLLMMNQAGLAMIEADSFDQVKGRCVYPLVFPEYLERFKALMKDIFEGKSGQLLFEMMGVKGKRLWLDTHAVPLRNEKGEIIAMLGVTRDVTAHKQAEEKINFLASIIQTLPDAVCSIDLGGNIFSWNEGAEKMLGYKPEEIIGKHIATIIPPELVRAELEHCINLLNNEGYFTGYESVRTTKDGKTIPVEITAVAMKDKEQRIMSYASIMRDISERKKLEDQLRQAQKMEAVGQLAGGVAHDFNNILTAIIGYASLLQMKTEENDSLRHYVDEIIASSERAANLTKNLLAFSRKQIIDLGLVNLSDIVKRIEKLLFSIIGEDIDLRIAAGDSDLLVMADSGQLEQVLVNLCTNARDAMPDGGILSIEADDVKLDEEFNRTHGYGKPGRYALLSVSDTGVGMDEKTRDRIFEPFFTTKEIGKGTGLGLSMAYGIIKQHNGFINVYSEPGKGTTFRIYLPLVESGQSRATLSEVVDVRGGTETILLAEDDADVRKLSKEVLEKFGYAVIEAVDGKDAITAFIENKDRIDLLILDVLMPKKNGKEVYEEIARIRPDIKALFTSGYTRDLALKKGILEEELHLLTKPIFPTELLSRVREVLDAE